MLPGRGQKRSGHENHGILQSVSWPCSKRDFSRTFEGSPSRIFGDFRRFHDFASFFYVVLNASRKQIASRYAHFLWFCMDPNNFRFKMRFEQSVGGRARREAGQFEVYCTKEIMFWWTKNGCDFDMPSRSVHIFMNGIWGYLLYFLSASVRCHEASQFN